MQALHLPPAPGHVAVVARIATLRQSRAEFSEAVRTVARNFAGLDTNKLFAPFRRNYVCLLLEALNDASQEATGRILPMLDRDRLMRRVCAAVDGRKSAIDIEALLWGDFHFVITALDDDIKQYSRGLH